MTQQPTWVSNSTISDFLTCPRAYFLKNIYKNHNNKKLALINPHLTVGIVVHEVLESLSQLRSDQRFTTSLLETFELGWKTYSGIWGGFTTADEEERYKEKGRQMIQRVMRNPGPLANKALKLSSPDHLPPRYLLSKDENIILCGKIDWLEYLPEHDAVHILDFKTGEHDEDEDSLQLPIYCLLVNNLQRRKVKKISYWYIGRENIPREMFLPNLEEAEKRVLTLAIQIKDMRSQSIYICKKNGCYACKPFEQILEGKYTFVGTKGYQDIYIQA